ncbi:hypothetical protein N0V93_009644 [Gnomoniopsis smithogilvyi]|uniref:UBX domain-containing protein 2 n=1 Tax=Gnomoniopsis smithogilvyi TaxID=1191159 RepID=A0A9W8YLF9_9PEZI|nr:hypothetical protein N0V93_009644 [Gnomoniopsis smithogilvyi]
MVFFTGTLQEGISTALQQSKLVVCFVTDDKEESKLWESQYLTDNTVAPLLEKDAVVLRLEAGSEEAGYLAAIFPLPKTPTVVIIRGGQLKEYVSAGTSKEDFLSRVSKAFSDQTESLEPPTGASAAPVTQRETSLPASTAPSNTTHNSPPAQTTASGQTQASSSSEQPQGPTQAQLLAEAERRRQIARKEREEIEKERRRKEKGKMPASQDPKQDDAVKKASQQLAERQRKAREDRARVLKLIEDDKAERRARSQRQRAERQASANDDAKSETAPEALAAPSSSAARRHDQCAIQVRLFDGSTIRTRFPAKATISQEVRKWIDESRTDGKEPYTFKIILNPMPNKAIDHATEEDQTLEELGLAPSSTLVLTPVDRYSSAYTNMNAGLTNPVSRLVTAVLAIVVNILGGITGALGGLGHVGTTASSTGEGNSVGASQNDRSEAHGQAAASGRDGSGRIKGFQNPDDVKRDHQLYNGNSLNFEPRKDEEDKDK